MGLTATPYVISALQHSAKLFRQTLMNGLGGTGVVTLSDLEVKPHVAANLSVNVEPGYIVIPGTQGSTAGQRANAGSQHATYASLPASFTDQGVYEAVCPSTENIALAEANAANARIDLVVATVQDAQYSGSFNQAILTAVTGTPAGSPVAPTPPENSVVLAQIAVAAKATKIEAAQITDKRPLSAGKWLGTAYSAPVVRADETEYEPSATTSTLVSLSIVMGTGKLVQVFVGGVSITSIILTGTGTEEIPFSFVCPAKAKWKTAQATESKSSYLPLF